MELFGGRLIGNAGLTDSLGKVLLACGRVRDVVEVVRGFFEQVHMILHDWLKAVAQIVRKLCDLVRSHMTQIRNA